MRGLLYKNFLLYRLDLIAIGGIQLLISGAVLLLTAGAPASGQTAACSLALYCCIFLISGLLEPQLFAPDESRTVSCFLLSAPGGAKGHIQSKYCTILIVDLLVLFCCFLTDALACGISGTTAYSTGSACMLLFCMNLLFSAFSTPFYIRFGSVFGNQVKFGVLGVLLLLGGIYGLFGDISFLFGDDPFGAVVRFLSSGWALLILSLIPAASVLLFYASYRLSIGLYRRGAERYEQ